MALTYAWTDFCLTDSSFYQWWESSEAHWRCEWEENGISFRPVIYLFEKQELWWRKNCNQFASSCSLEARCPKTKMSRAYWAKMICWFDGRSDCRSQKIRRIDMVWCSCRAAVHKISRAVFSSFLSNSWRLVVILVQAAAVRRHAHVTLTIRIAWVDVWAKRLNASESQRFSEVSCFVAISCNVARLSRFWSRCLEHSDDGRGWITSLAIQQLGSMRLGTYVSTSRNTRLITLSDFPFYQGVLSGKLEKATRRERFQMHRAISSLYDPRSIDTLGPWMGLVSYTMWAGPVRRGSTETSRRPGPHAVVVPKPEKQNYYPSKVKAACR